VVLSYPRIYVVFQRDAMTFNLILTNALDSFKRILALVTPPLTSSLA
jgi:hypothetical protein